MCWGHHDLHTTLLTWEGVVQAHQVIGPLDLLQAHGLLLLEDAVRVHGGGLRGTHRMDRRSKQEAHLQALLPKPPGQCVGAWGGQKQEEDSARKISGPAGALTPLCHGYHGGSSPSPVQRAAFTGFHPSLGLRFHVFNNSSKHTHSTVLLCARITLSYTYTV